MNSDLWVDKYRPTDVSKINSHKSIIDLLFEMKHNKSISNLLCYGPSGCGKTTTMLAFGNNIYKNTSSVNIMRINASDERGISMIRDKIIKFIQTQSLFPNKDPDLPYKMIILDEADYMTDDAQFAITNIMDQYENILFVFICNYIHKIHNVIQSRCQILYFSYIPIDYIKQILSGIIKKEKIDISKNAIQTLCEISKFDLRTALYMLQSLHCSDKRLTPTNIYKYNQYPTEHHIKKIFEIINQQNITECYKYICCIIKEKGILLKNIIHQLYNNIINIEKIPEDTIKQFIQNFAILEQYLTYEHTHQILIGNLVSALYTVKNYLDDSKVLEISED